GQGVVPGGAAIPVVDESLEIEDPSACSHHVFHVPAVPGYGVEKLDPFGDGELPVGELTKTGAVLDAAKLDGPNRNLRLVGVAHGVRVVYDADFRVITSPHFDVEHWIGHVAGPSRADRIGERHALASASGVVHGRFEALALACVIYGTF